MNNPEILSPAGNFESLKMAVMAGATAVYFGAKNFNARAKADNFGADINQAVALAHMYGVKAYLTLNTLIENDEIDELCNTIEMAIEANIDAFIVQDFGVVNILKNCFPQAVIHASTQMAVNNYEGAINASNMGIKRVVLSRETSLEDIKLIKEKTNLEIEYFVQGALCVCLSGNCYLSSCVFNKSGNRGECLQPCRLPYKAILKGKQIGQGYLFSAKDINMSHRLKDLINAGVNSFKIEGRLRRPAYVYSVTKTYKKIIGNNFQTCENDQVQLKKAFNRGDYCEGYFNGNGNIIDCQIQGHKGIKIGNVVSFNKGQKFNIITIKSKQINKGDGLKFIKNGKEEATITAVDIKHKNDFFYVTTTSNVSKDSEVYLIMEKQEEDIALKSLVRLPISFKLTALKNKPLKLEYTLTYGINSSIKYLCGEVLGDICIQANSIALNKESAIDCIGKLNDTYFCLQDLEILTDNVFVTKKQLNEIRRKVVENITNYFIQKNVVKLNKNYLNKYKNININNKKIYSLEIAEKYNSNADFFVIKPKDYLNFDFKKILHNNCYLYIPSFLPNIDLEIIKNILKNNSNLGIYAQNIGALNLGEKIILGAKLNIKNIFAIDELLNSKVKLVEASPELSNDNFNKLNSKFDVPIIKSNFSDFELMTFVHCPIKTLFKNKCSNCKYQEGIEYIMQNGTKLVLQKYKLINCYFSLTKK